MIDDIKRSIEVLGINPLILTLSVYAIFCLIQYLEYLLNKKREWFLAKIFMISICWVVVLALSASLGDMRWLAVAFLMLLAVYLFIYARRVNQKQRLKKKRYTEQ
jgi:uncharacterized membrane protein YfcA